MRRSYWDVVLLSHDGIGEQRQIEMFPDDYVTPDDMNFPTDQQRLSIVGKTGSGKTHAALWHLSRRDYDTKPWIIFDYKYDEIINSIEGIVELPVGAEIPEEPGLYVIHPTPGVDEEAIERMMIQIWQKENTGVFVDEGYMVGNRNKAFRNLLTQGRSKHIPMIVLSQRPVWMDRFVFSESDFFQVFRLQSKADWDQVKDFVPFSDFRNFRDVPPEQQIRERPPHYSFYYDSNANTLDTLRAVPDRKAILNTFNTRLEGVIKV